MADYKNKKIQSDFLWIFKALAVISVVSAHVSGINAGEAGIAKGLSLFMKSIGSVGVGVFFLISGYLYCISRQKYPGFGSFFRRKAGGGLIPWFFCASLVYLYVALRKGFSVQGWVTSVLGYYSSFWYMSVLWILMFAFFYFYNSKLFLGLTVIISVASSVIVGLNIIPPSVFHVYLNPFNWMIWFSFGIIINRIGLHRLLKLVSRLGILLVMLMLASFVLLACLDVYLSYKSVYYIPLEFISVLAFAAISLYIVGTKSKVKDFFVDLGKKSFSIYLLHEFGFAGLTVYLCNRFNLWWTTPVRPVLVCLAVYLCIKLGQQIAIKLHLEKIYFKLIGGRQ